MSKNKNNIRLFILVTAFYWFSMYAYIPTFSPYIESLGASHKMIGLILGSYGFTQMLIRIPLGIYSDRINKKKIFVNIGILLSFLSTAGMWFAETPALILVFRSLAGASAATWVSFTVLFSSYFEKDDTAHAIGLINASNKSGQVVGMLLGGIIAQALGQQFPFLLAAAGAVVGFSLSLKVDEKKDVDHQAITFKEILKVGRNKSLLTVSFLAILMMMISHSTTFGFIPVAAKNLGATSFHLGLLTTITTIPGILSSYLSGSYFSQRLGEKNTVTVGFSLLALSCLLVPLIDHLYLLYFNQMLNGFAQGMIFPVLMGLSIKNVEANKRGTAMGFFQAIYGLGMFTGPIFVGTISDLAGLKMGFWMIGLVGILGAVLSRFYKAEKV
ncbi:putative MFS family arabinose efflux permease [Halanaerobium saccharolyticum]|jgi:predicted MFS family arabinose efflux permease|uniref:Putative MFS family arabinose efflux permease n=1 Tax=Halanaerobium saccharolyticum TaxID=43595 RepID=A0A2T5RIZ4_9FIRM|nr:MFS transporter [Halanaerobium saccharolyticum]PTV98360.1 putative MFS family arabinose efflux permease [Halanaerobium saccharolyticum]